MKINNPQAFTSTNKTSPYGDGETIYDNDYGMTLLDYFAAKALGSVCRDLHFNGFTYKEISAISYNIAKAMLSEREKELKELQDEPHTDWFSRL